MASATRQISSTPSFFNFLKQGLLLPTHNRRLFATIFTIIVASSCLLRLGYLDTKALNSTDPSSPDVDLHVIQQKIQDDTRALLLARAPYFLFGAITRAAIHVVVLFAAVATYSGELHTFGSLLGKVKAQLKGPVLTLAFVYALQVDYVLLSAMIGLVFVLMVVIYSGSFFLGSLLMVVPLTFIYLFLGSLLMVVPLTFIYLVYFSFLGPLSVIVAVTEPDCHCTGALGRAWQLVKGKRRRAVLAISVTAVLAAALTPVYTLAKRCERTSMAAGLLLGFLYSILKSAVQLFEACAMTALYYECKGSTEAARHVKVSAKKQLDA